MNVVLTEEEAKVVMQALDVTVRQGGLNASVSVLPIAQKIERQLTPVKEPETTA